VTPVVRLILSVTVAAFFLQQTLPAIANALVFVPRLVVFRPWSILTYMLLHGSFMHILFNMLGVFFFGPRVEERIGSRSFAILYLLSGVSGALLSFLFSPAAPIIGASAGVFGIMLAFAYFWPNDPIYLWMVVPVPARILVIITTVLTLWSGISGSRSGVAHFAHLGGYVGAYAYLKWLDRKRTTFKRRVENAPTEANERVAGWRKVDLARVHEVNRDEVNRILDKISARGIDSLTEKERLFLSNFVPADDRVPPKT
jgi:membrane associated rhomboid family serine protease